MKIHSGISMIEVFISMGIISLVLLSLLNYQISMIKNNNQMLFANIATIQLINFSDMLYANKTNAQRDAVIQSWNNDNANLLPQGQGNYSVVDDHQCAISLNWFLGKQKSESMEVFC